MTFPSLEMNTFLAGGFNPDIGDNPAELMLVTKVGAIGRIPAVRTTDIEPSGFVILLMIVGVVFEPSPPDVRNGVVTMFDAGLLGVGS
jgi:hypothetical protein